MFFSKLRTMASIVFALTVVAAGLGAAARVAAEDPKDAVPQAGDAAAPAPGRQPRTVNDLMADVMKDGRHPVVALPPRSHPHRPGQLRGDPGDQPELALARVRSATASRSLPCRPDVDAQRFKAEVMAHVRSIEQQYWTSPSRTSSSGRARRPSDWPRRSSSANWPSSRSAVARRPTSPRASSGSEQFKLDLVTKTSDVITTERQLRNILGLPPADSRRIVPVTAPVEAQSSPDWETCVAGDAREASRNPPGEGSSEGSRGGIARRQSRRGREIIPSGTRRPRTGLPPAVDTLRDRSAQSRTAEGLPPADHPPNDSLAGPVLPRGRRQLQAVQDRSRLRRPPPRRLEAQRAFYEEGRITIDRYFDSVSQYASAVAQEAQFKTTYNIALAGPGRSEGNVAGARSDRRRRKSGPVLRRDGQAGRSDEDRVVCVPEGAPQPLGILLFFLFYDSSIDRARLRM